MTCSHPHLIAGTSTPDIAPTAHVRVAWLRCGLCGTHVSLVESTRLPATPPDPTTDPATGPDQPTDQPDG